MDREEELEAIARTIRNRGKLFLIGPRRYGKTSLLAAASERAGEDGAIVLRFDAERYETLPLLARAILTAAARGLRTPLERIASLLGEVAGRLRPEVSLDPATGEIGVRIGVAEGEELPVLADALDAVEGLAGKVEEPVAVMLDEVQQIVIEHGLAGERQLRSTVQRHRDVAYVFAGSDTRLLGEMTTDPNRPFYRFGARIFVREIPEDALRAHLGSTFYASGMEVEEEGMSALLGLADRVPYNVQRLAHEVWERLRVRAAEGETAAERDTRAASGDEARAGRAPETRTTAAPSGRPVARPVVDAEEARAALGDLLQKEDPAYTQIWTSLSLNQKKAVKAVRETDGTEVLAAAVARELRISVSSLQTALRQLEDLHILRRDPRGEKERYRLVDPFLAEWVRRSQAL